MVEGGGRRGGSRLPAGAAGVGEASFGLRVRALTRSRPVVELAASVRRLERLPHVDAVALALAAVDLVMARQGLPDAVTYEEAVDVLRRLSVVAAPGAAAEAHHALAVHVLDTLLNKGEHQARFRYEVGNWGTDAVYRASVLEFWLLREREDRASGQLILHADADAINALVAGLAFDVADEQAAAELVLRRQIERGEFGKAEPTAQRNVQLSVQYADGFDALLAETRRDVRSAAPRWLTEVPERLEAARAHLTERLNQEDALLEHLRQVIDRPRALPGLALPDDPEGEDVDVVAAAARAARLLERCRERHLELMRRVLEAINVFLDAQRDQAFRLPGSLRLPEMGAEVLRPLLRSTVGPAADVGAAFLRALAPSPRRMIRLGDVVETLLAPARAVIVTEPLREPEGPGEEAPAAVPPTLVLAARGVVASVGLPARLSDLLRRAALVDPDGEVGSLLASAALWLFAPDAAEGGAESVAYELFGPSALAAADGADLAARMPAELPGGPWYGDDLLVAASEGELLDTLGPPTVTMEDELA